MEDFKSLRPEQNKTTATLLNYQTVTMECNVYCYQRSSFMKISLPLKSLKSNFLWIILDNISIKKVNFIEKQITSLFASLQ